MDAAGEASASEEPSIGTQIWHTAISLAENYTKQKFNVTVAEQSGKVISKIFDAIRNAGSTDGTEQQDSDQ